MKSKMRNVFVALCAVWLAGVANAVTLGKVAPPNLGGCSNCEVFQRRVGAGEPSYTVPAGNWTITSWSAQGGGTAAGKARLRVYRPTSTLGQFRLVRQTIRKLIPASGHPSFATSLNVRGGDLLGLEAEGNLPSTYATSVNGDREFVVFCSPTLGQLVGKGTTCTLAPFATHLVNVSAELIPR
jgi:hypothetical protein